MGISYIPPVNTRGDLAPGQVWCVNSRRGHDTNNSGKNWASALATVDAAVNKSANNTNDVILVAPDHAETFSATAGVTVDVNGIAIIGLRQGGMMPTFTFDTSVDSDVIVSGNNVLIENIRFINDLDATTGILNITGNDVTILNCEYRTTTGEATDVIVTNNALRLVIDGWRHIGALADGGDSAIMLDECDHAIVRNCHIIGNFDVGAIECRTTACDDIWIHHCTIKTAGSEDLIIADTITGSTGFIGPEINCELADNAANITEAVAGATFTFIQPIRLVNLVGESSLETNITASTD